MMSMGCILLFGWYFFNYYLAAPQSTVIIEGTASPEVNHWIVTISTQMSPGIL